MEPIKQKYFSDTQVALLLGVRPTSVRRWRQKNKAAGQLKYGPPYEYRGSSVVYPVADFRRWCAEVKVEGGVLRLNLPLSAPLTTTLAGTKPAVEAERQLAFDLEK